MVSYQLQHCWSLLKRRSFSLSKEKKESNSLFLRIFNFVSLKFQETFFKTTCSTNYEIIKNPSNVYFSCSLVKKHANTSNFKHPRGFLDSLWHILGFFLRNRLKNLRFWIFSLFHDFGPPKPLKMGIQQKNLVVCHRVVK